MSLVAVAYLASHFLSILGNGILAVALPLIVLQTTGSPLSVGVVATATAVPALAVGLCAGIVIDRVNRRTCSMVSDVVSAAAVAALPVVDMVWGLSLWWLVALAIAGSFGDVPGMTARQVMVPVVARHAGMSLERLIGLRQSMTSAALVIGPAVAGTSISLFNGSTVLFATAATSAGAALLTATVPHRLGSLDPDHDGREALWTQLSAGVTMLRRSRFLTGTVALTVGLATAFGGLQGLVLPLYFDQLSRPELLGFVLTALALGMLLGTTMFAWMGTRIPRRRWLVAALIGTTTGFSLVSTLTEPPVVFAGAALFGFANAVLGGVVGVLQTERITDGVRGRVLSLQNAALQVAVPAGIGVAGVVAQYGSLGAAGLTLLAAWLSVVGVLVGCRALTDADTVDRI